MLLILLGFHSEVELSLLQDTILYIHKKLFKSLLWTIGSINTVISELEYMDIIELSDDYYPKVKITHDKVYYSLLSILKSDINKSLISYYFLMFLKNNFSLQNYNSELDLDYLIAFHAYSAQVTDWEIINYNYGKQLYDNHAFFDAAKIFSRINPDFINLSNLQKLIIAKCYYETGEYFNAKSILNRLEIVEEDRKFNFDYHYFMGKTENILLNKMEAIGHYEDAYKYADNREDPILMLHLKHLSLLETPSGKENAKVIFDSIALHLNQDEEHMISVCYLLRNCNQFYTGKPALEFFDRALKIAEEHHSNVYIAYVHNNYGLELFRTEFHREANDKFVLAYEILLTNKIHESSYPLNNMAVYKMFQGDYSTALGYLLDANYFNQSLYASLAIKMHMMICYRELGKEKNCRKLMAQLSNYLKHEKINDFNIIRKLTINLCITHLRYDEKISAKEYIYKAYPYIKDTISEYRGITLYNLLFNKNISLENAMQENLYYTRLDYEPWIITLSHD